MKSVFDPTLFVVIFTMGEQVEEVWLSVSDLRWSHSSISAVFPAVETSEGCKEVCLWGTVLEVFQRDEWFLPPLEAYRWEPSDGDVAQHFFAMSNRRLAVWAMLAHIEPRTWGRVF